MGMLYIVGFNEKQPFGYQWTEFDCNSTTDFYLRSLIKRAIQDTHPKLYEKITEELFFEQIRFDGLSSQQFMDIVFAIRTAISSNELSEAQRQGAKIWEAAIEPLVVVDERYHLYFKIK
ncbi:hypothetical protein [Acinetobacter proteolyticus]|uniref:Uncharacterized protein n=1 Tax=Acinetobacter proteolyticus TaxID=1776741 RepID=A0A2N0WB40_9GAMM|nr:hypothetical protein [Acinetobacter proteolyticus]PKF31725.1 hypothetical protein CW311_15865 [Acinetobacter proteolyticus]